MDDSESSPTWWIGSLRKIVRPSLTSRYLYNSYKAEKVTITLPHIGTSKDPRLRKEIKIMEEQLEEFNETSCHAPLEYWTQRDVAAYPPLYCLYDYLDCAKETLVPDMRTKDCRQFLVTGRYIFVKYCKFNHHADTNKLVTFIMEELKIFIDEPLVITG